MEKYLTCEDVAKRYGVNTDTVWAWVRQGKLNAIRLGRNYRIRPQDLDALEKKQETATTTGE